jgi:hypothetical protein
MTWEEQLFAYFDDLEQQAEGVFGLERDLEVAERAAAEYAAVTAASRLMASVGGEVALQVQGLGHVAGCLRRVADGWCLVQSPAQAWIVRQDAVMSMRGPSPRSVPEAAWPVAGKLGFGSALRRLADSGGPCRLVLLDGTRIDAQVIRVGRDFVELRQGDSREPALVRFGAIAAVTGASGPEAG